MSLNASSRRGYPVGPSEIRTVPPHPIFAGASCAFGVFDGIHRGHRFILEKTIDEARVHGGASMIVTFDIDPDEIFAPAKLRKIMSNADRLAHLAASGVDEVVTISFDETVRTMQPERFLDTLFFAGVPKTLFVGEDLRFGCEASGDVSLLKAWGNDHGMEVVALPLFQQEGHPVTSTRIRTLVLEGKVEEVERLLGQPFALSGQVVAGRQMGREMGIATANLQVPAEGLIPADGVYAGYALVDGQRFKAAISVGVPITFEGVRNRTVEAHLLGFSGDIYAEGLMLQFIRYLRPMIKFDGPETLASQIRQDIEATFQLP